MNDETQPGQHTSAHSKETTNATAQGAPTDFATVLGDLNAGVTERQINRALSDVAANVCTTGKVGEVVLKLKFKQIGQSNQVTVSADLRSVIPQVRGRIIEETDSDTPMHVGKGGKLTLFPEEQRSFGFGKGN